MRIPTWLRLAMLCLIAGSVMVFSSTVFADKPRPPQAVQGPPRPPEVKKPLIKEEFKGYGVTVTLAQNDAVREACRWLEENGGLGWSPDPQYLRDHNMIRFVGEPEEKEIDAAGKVKVVKAELEISTQQARDIQKQAQHERMKSRQGLSLLVVIGVVCFLAVVGGYLRLEEATKGYYTRLLRVAAVVVLLVIIAGLCVIA
jgi:hypothetical protein